MPHSIRLCITHCGNLKLCPARRRVLHALLAQRHPAAARACCLHVARADWQYIMLFVGYLKTIRSMC